MLALVVEAEREARALQDSDVEGPERAEIRIKLALQVLALLLVMGPERRPWNHMLQALVWAAWTAGRLRGR